jgi:hypothetical protein
MGYNYQQKELTHKQIILQQILMCNKIFSGFEATPTIIDPLMGTTDYKTQAHTAKAILLSVLTLEANARPILPENYAERTTQLKKEILTPLRYKYKDGSIDRQYYGIGLTQPDPERQIFAILQIHELYQEILAAIYSLPKFSDAIPQHQIAKNEKITELEIGEMESVEFTEE